jgi:cytochrome c oxidase subunit II
MGNALQAVPPTDLGEAVYRAQCMACHQESGEGIEGVFASLVGSPVVEGAASGLVEVIVAGQGEMPGLGALLSDEEVAAVASYVRRQWGTGSDPSVSVATVASVRGEAEAERGAEIDPGGVEGRPAAEAGSTLQEGWQDQARTLVAHNCVVCHQSEGEGVAGAYPALAGNPVVVGPVDPLIRVIRDGRAGMPRFGFLSDEDLAMVLSYIRTAWGNSAGLVEPGALRALP